MPTGERWELKGPALLVVGLRFAMELFAVMATLFGLLAG